MGRVLTSFIRIVDKSVEWVGWGTAFLIPVIVIIATFEVIARYVFNAPTIWAWDINKMLFGVVTGLGAGFTLLKKGHVSVDVFYSKWSNRKKAFADCLTFPLFLIFISILLWTVGNLTLISIQEREVLSTIWSPAVYPMKVLITIGIFLLLVKGIADFILKLRIVIKNDQK